VDWAESEEIAAVAHAPGDAKRENTTVQPPLWRGAALD
jgi:hypothetical protein